MRRLFYLIVIAASLAASCNNSQQQTGTADSTHTAAAPPAARKAPASALSAEGTADLTALLTAYYELKDAMVAADTSKADVAATRVLSAGETLKNRLNADTAHQALLPRVETVMKQSEAITGNKMNNIELKRTAFEQVSDAMYALLKEAKMTNAGVYRQFCPMAFNDKGAYWLSNEEEIKNPYFGKKMLECGEVRDSL